jgi:ankyrin repeat protein
MAIKTKRKIGLLLALLLAAEVAAIACSFSSLSPQAAEKRAVHLSASGVDDRVAGLTPLHLAALRADREAVRSLARGRLVNQPDCMGLTPLHHAVAEGEVEVVKLLLARGADANAVIPGTLETPLQESAFLRDPAIMQLLLEHDANPNPASADGETPLLLSAQLGHSEEVRLLVAIGADLNTQDSVGCTALHYAAFRGDANIVQTLLGAGANHKTKDVHGATALALAKTPEITKLLRAAGAEEESSTSETLVVENIFP